MDIIKTENLCFDYILRDDDGKIIEQSTALRNVNLSVPEGQFLAVLGHNGCGKSTLAKHFNAILTPTSGKVTVDGIDTADEDRLFDIRQTVGMVFQNPDNQLVATIVEEDVAFAPENLGVPPEEIRVRVDNALKQVDMYEFPADRSSVLLLRALSLCSRAVSLWTSLPQCWTRRVGAR